MSNKFKQNSYRQDNPREVYVALIGAPGVGKSALMVKYITKRFIGEYDPIYEGIWQRSEFVDGKEVIIQIHDTYDKDRKNLEKYIKWSDYLILVYSITNHDSFLEAQKYLDTIQDLLAKYGLDELNNGLQIKILLLGTKLDLERYREVHKHDVESVIEKYSSNKTNEINMIIIRSMETTSCEEYEIVQNVFVKLIKEIKNDRENSSSIQQFNYINNNNNSIDDINNNNNNNNGVINSNKQNNKGATSLNYSKSRSKSPKPPLNNNNNNSNNSVNSSSNNSNIISSSYLNSNEMSNISHSQSLSTQLYNTNPNNNSAVVGGGVFNNLNENNLKNNNNSNNDINASNVSLTQHNSQSYQNIITHNSNNSSKKQSSSKFPFLTKILNKS